MKDIYHIKASLMALAAMVACTEMEIRDESQDTTNNGLLQELNITGKDFLLDGETRSSVTIGESGASFAWDEDDVIGIFPDKGDQVSFAMDEGAGTQTATFSGGGWALKSSAKYAAYYPHVYENRDLTAIPVSYVGQTQNGNGNTDHIGAYDFMAAGVSTPENGTVAFDMQHLGALVQLTITVPEPSTLTKVVLTSSTKFTETGTIDLTADTPAITAVTQSNTFEIALNNAATTEANENVTAYFMVAPVDLTDSELTMTVHLADESTCEVELTGKNLQAGKAYRLFAELKETIPNNQIWYTSSDGNVVNPTYENAFEANIVSNIYENGKGIITFDSEVTSVGEYAFEYNSTLTNIVIPKSVTTIGEGAFFCCNSLLELTIPSSVVEIGAKILYKCAALTSIVVDKENTMYDSRNNCNAIIETETNTLICGCCNSVIPDNVTKIHDYAFVRIQNLTSIIIPRSVTTIGEEAFYECTSLTNIDFSNGLIKIGTNAFRSCPITIIDFPNSVTHIEDFAFANCTLTNITLPNNLQVIGQYAFMGCAELTTVKVKAAAPPSMSNNAFKWGNSNLVIHVPAGSLEAYKTADYWKDLNLIEQVSSIQAIDLGLSVKWANCNVGADSPEKAGGYYSWGETEEKSNYDHSTYLWSNRDDMNWKMTKYCTDSEYGTIDNKTVLESEDDVANVKLGDGWRMPTIDEFQELFNNCSWEWTSMNGVNGYKISGNGNSIFLPAAGSRYYDETDVRYFSELGAYWSASLHDEESNTAWGFSFEETDFYEKDRVSRYPGATIRPVKK